MNGYRTLVDHTVMFYLDNPGDVVSAGDGQWARLDAVTIHLYENRDPRIWAGGTRCRKDGERDRRMGNISVSVDLPDSDVWIDRAHEVIRSTVVNVPHPLAAPGVVPVPRNTRQDGDDTETETAGPP